MSETLEEFKERIRKQYAFTYYDRQGKEIDREEWEAKIIDNDYKIVKQQYYDRWFISTVWLGAPAMLSFRSEENLIFETMIFYSDRDSPDIGDDLVGYQERYATEDQAKIGHQNAVLLCHEQLQRELLIKTVVSRVVENAKDLQLEDLDRSK